ncbi:MAG: hypothetical protein Q7S19_01980 [bacterium]|nr:hypothetical protein [bacterium]
MIYLIYGNQRDRVLVRSKEIIDKALATKSGALHFKFSAEGFEKAKFEELIAGRSLFAEKVVVLCDGLMFDAEISVYLSKKIGEISESDNIFVFREEKLNKSFLDLFKKSEAKIEEFSIVENKKGYAGAREVKLRAGYEGFNIFSFTDALGARDKKLAWVLYQKALRAGFPAEEIFWKAVWLFRNLILASGINKDQKDLVSKLKISPYTFDNSRKFLKNYTEPVLLDKYKKLVDIYHQFRRGIVESDVAIEQFILNL